MILPEDKPCTPKREPHNFFIYGATMSGKSYFASFFPHPLVLNTDGNSEQGTAPSIQIRNVRDRNGHLKMSCITQLDEIITALQQPDCTFKTVIVDVIDDICVMLEQAICLKNNADSLGDIGYGRGYAQFKAVLQQFVMDLKALDQDVIFVSREERYTDEQSHQERVVPSLKTKYYNIVNGNCDLVIHTEKFGKNVYRRSVKDYRQVYKAEDVTNERVRKLLASVEGLFEQIK
ncbi:AAA family ATPase [Ligilactobacillus ruminis]|jgi:hypothetical protein|uniref:AAA family ATPase n=1 Tax=Ligilactobacillus ruminis TaxID=1623 RepID=UPI00232EEEF6|nr:AAA family ATPase [Ligilactobacillus ruminis]MDB7642425.1 AAA family ATPase [Ligilactobacillus ruminis]MDB7647013.1 AAA family ATPase [Ligilactobacillus ruminis]MDB7649025.1 AAA family ATPase [Ligilactobacillus ruminis]